MLYVFFGSNIGVNAKKAHSLLASLRDKRPDAAFISIDADSWSVQLIEENLGGQGLFSSKYIIFLDRITENAEAKEKILDFIPAMNESANIFIVLEGKLNAELKKSFEKHAEKIVESSDDGDGASMKGEELNIFTLADAFGARDPIRSWSIYRNAIDIGIPVESIVGTLFWQIKSMIIASKTKNAGEAGLNPFVFGKSKRYATNFSDRELQKLSRDLVVLYHEGHSGTVDIEIDLEKMLLSLKQDRTK
ncbi:MAG: hypothetical protein WCW03_01275 [Candidatus Paceibacterota bacterium]|jgi:DNA polymerase III delta subunit